MIESAGWHPDPSRRHEYRYWNGWVWTDAVADRGVMAVDPLTLWQPPTAPAERKPWSKSAKIGITAAVGILLLGSAVASGIAVHDQAQTTATPPAVYRPVPRTVPTTTTTTAPPVRTTRARAFLNAARDPRAGPLATEDDASLLDLGRAGCNALHVGLTATFLSSTLHAHEPDVTLAQARYFVSSIPLLCPGR